MHIFCLICGYYLKHKNTTYYRSRYRCPLRWFYYYYCPYCNKFTDYTYYAKHQKKMISTFLLIKNINILQT